MKCSQVANQRRLTVVDVFGFDEMARSLQRTRITLPSTTGTAYVHKFKIKLSDDSRAQHVKLEYHVYCQAIHAFHTITVPRP